MTREKLLRKMKSKKYEIKHSSLAKISEGKITYEQCRRYACEDIARSLTHIPKSNSKYLEIPEGTDFHFIGRVDTNSARAYDPESYYSTFKQRKFIAFSSINSNNISHYRGAPFFVYNILPEDIVHIFPMDSSTDRDAKSEEELTRVPSLWITLEELDALTMELGVYNQITCKTKRNGEIIKPAGIVSFSERDEARTKEIAERFQIKFIKVHPNKGALDYGLDVLYVENDIKRISSKMQERYGMTVYELFFEI